ncbi:MAG: GNAT family N-acetyltransferase [Planctomycetota bacterium]|nr:GNAT family N-acetyltransferase [Planctomycetota bacterium]
MKNPIASLGTQAPTAELRASYLSQLTGPLDDMWLAFADMATCHSLVLDGEVVGMCRVDDERRLLRFHVEPTASDHAGRLLELILDELEVEAMIVHTTDPGFLSAALDHSDKVVADSLLFAAQAKPEGPGLDELALAEGQDHARIVDFQEAATGMPRAFLEPYASQRLELGELLLLEEDGELTAVGELRRDQEQPGIAHLGVIVHAERRGRGIATRLLTELVHRCHAEGLAAHCSPELTTRGARRAIARAGFRANHRLLRVTR